jgi:SAM-dependent methyltransferase
MTSPSDRRSPERLRVHFEVERELASRLKAAATREDRSRILATMYTELFARVPDHPRLTVQRDPAAEARQVARLLHLLRPHLKPGLEYVEFGAGAGALALAVCPFVGRVRAVEIADQIPATAVRPANFELVIYDGYEPGIEPGTVDLVFSEQFVEHLHPQDAEDHFALVHRLLRPGGRYLLRTPERWTGPHDVSRAFSDTPQGFHLREWSYPELAATARRIGFRRQIALWNGGSICLRWSLAGARVAEGVVRRIPRRWRFSLGRRVVPSVTMVLEK